MIPDRISRWWLAIKDAARLQGINAYTLAAICDRETLGGEAESLDVRSERGTGDHAPRHGLKYHGSGRYKSVGLRAVRQQDGTTLTLEHFMPKDGRGWGRGLFQIDYAAQPEFCDQLTSDGRYAWEIAGMNAQKAAEILAHALHRFMDDERITDAELPAIAAYNAGEGNSRHIIEQLTVPISETSLLKALDELTTGGDYVTDVLRRRSGFLMAPPPATAI